MTQLKNDQLFSRKGKRDHEEYQRQLRDGSEEKEIAQSDTAAGSEQTSHIDILQYGGANTSLSESQDDPESPIIDENYYDVSDVSRSHITEPIEPTMMRVELPHPGDQALQDLDLKLQGAFNSPDIATSFQSSLESCFICTEDFSPVVTPPKLISLACQHKPSVCSDCVERSIKSDLDNKMWNRINYPECGTPLSYEDIRRLADPQTFGRYESLSFRSALSKDANFVWCQNCDFGQFHNGGLDLPIVRCQKCGFRSCFHHAVAWHDNLSCEDYEKILQDLDGSQSTADKSDEKAVQARRLQHDNDERLARKLDLQERQAEQSRQRALQEETSRRVRLAQEAEVERERQELDIAGRREEIKRRATEEKLSVATVHATTKLCPGCKWPIEKNAGCSHMTCTQCAHQFCWYCLRSWPSHRPRCRR